MRLQRDRHAVMRVLLAVNLAAGLLGEMLHHEQIALRLSADTVVVPHGCGARERHIPLDNLHPCALCLSYSHRVFTFVSLDADAAPVRMLLCTFFPERIATLSHARPCPATRGPPAA
jgi:hypothetical protein